MGTGYRCDVPYRGPKLVLEVFLLLDAENGVTCGNALRHGEIFPASLSPHCEADDFVKKRTL